MDDNSVVRKEFELLVKEKKYTIWQLCKKYNKSIHCTFYKFLNGLYENHNEFLAIKKEILENSNREEIHFSKDYFSDAVLSGKTFNDIAEETGYTSGIVLYKYLLELYKDDIDVYESLKKRLFKNSTNEKYSSITKDISLKNTKEKLVILLTSDFIAKFEPEYLLSFTKNIDADVEFRVLSFTIDLFKDKNFKLIEKLYLLPNLKFVEFGSFYCFNFPCNENYLVTHSFLSVNKKNKTRLYPVDNDVVLRYLALNFESLKNIVVATNCKSLVLNVQRLDIRTLSSINENIFMIKFNENFDNRYLYTTMDTNVIFKYPNILNNLKYKKYRCIISEAVIFEMDETNFFRIIYQASQLDGIVFDISKKFSYDDFIYNDLCILVNNIILSKRNLITSFVSTEDKTLRIESTLCEMWNSTKYNDILKEDDKEDEVDETEIIKQIKDENITINEDNFDSETKEQANTSITLKETSTSTVDVDIFKTIIFSKFIGNYGLINTSICTNIEMVFNSKRIIISKEKINTRASKEQVYKTMIGYLIKFKDIDNLYEIISFNGKNNLKKTDLTL